MIDWRDRLEERTDDLARDGGAPLAKTSDQTLTLTLPNDLADWVDGRVAEPGLESAEAYVRDLIRRDRDRSRAIADLQQAIDEAVDDVAAGRVTDFDAERIVGRGRERSKSRARSA